MAAAATESMMADPIHIAPYLDAAADAFFVPFRWLEDTVLTPFTATSLQHNFDSIKSVHARVIPIRNVGHMAAICAFYVAMVAIGQMRLIPVVKSKAVIRPIAAIHNAFLVVLSAYMWLGVLYESYRLGYSLFDNNRDETPVGVTMAKILGVFYLSKVVEFFDTFLMFVKGNYRQVSFLHCYHHLSIFMIWWLTTHWAPSGEAYFSSSLNSFVHVVMYTYYLMTTLNMHFLVAPIKKYITQMQMTQFVMNMVQSSYNTFVHLTGRNQGNYPLGLNIILWFYMITLLVLFSNFYKGDRKREKTLRMERPRTDSKMQADISKELTTKAGKEE